MCFYNYQAGYYCQHCGTFVPTGVYHFCSNNWTTTPYYNYKCPKCKGEFNTAPANGTKGFCCPFCGEEMKGLNQ